MFIYSSVVTPPLRAKSPSCRKDDFVADGGQISGFQDPRADRSAEALFSQLVPQNTGPGPRSGSGPPGRGKGESVTPKPGEIHAP